MQRIWKVMDEVEDGKKKAFHIDEVRGNCKTGMPGRANMRGLKTVEK